MDALSQGIIGETERVYWASQNPLDGQADDTNKEINSVRAIMQGE